MPPRRRRRARGRSGATEAQTAALEALRGRKEVAISSTTTDKDGNLRVRYTMQSADGQTVEFDSTIDADGKTSTSVLGVTKPVETPPKKEYNTQPKERPIDNGQPKSEKTADGNPEQTGNDFQRIQAESRGMSDEEREAFRRGRKTLDDWVSGDEADKQEALERRARVVSGLSRRIRSANNGAGLGRVKKLTSHNKDTGKSTSFKFGRVDGDTFHDVFEVARNYLKNGELVDLHDSYGKDVKCFLSEDGLCGFAVEPDGNLVSVFSLRKGSLRAMADSIIKAGATHLDAYASKSQDLQKIYRNILEFDTASDLPDAWTPEEQKPLERVAHVLRNTVTVGGKKVEVEFLNKRPETDGPGAFKNSNGVTVGEYDTNAGKIRLYPGARVADVVHEFTHPLMDYARAEAKAGRGEFLNKVKEIIDAERETWEQPVRDAYKGKGEEEILEEIFTHAMGKKGEKLFGKSTNTLQGRQWYKQMWEKIKGLWQDFATKMGWNKADLRGLERMSPEDAAQKILSEMVKGRTFGDAPVGGDGVRNMSLVGKREDGIEVYESDAEVRKLPFDERVKKFVDLMRNEYAGRTARFTKDGKTYYATFDKGGIGKNAYGDNQSDAAGRDAKINTGASGDIFDLVENAQYDHSKPESGKIGKMHKDVKLWDYFDKTVQIDGKVFDVLVNVRDKGNDQFVYNVALRANNKLRANGRLLDHEDLASGAVGSTRSSLSHPPRRKSRGYGKHFFRPPVPPRRAAASNTACLARKKRDASRPAY